MNKRFVGYLLISVVSAFALLGCTDSRGAGRYDELQRIASSPESALRVFTAREGAISACMRRAGFKYLPKKIPSTVRIVSDIGFDGIREAGKEGFGISTAVTPAGTPQGFRIQDPNEAYMRELPDAQRAAYLKSLYGIVSGQPYDPLIGAEACFASGNRSEPEAITDVLLAQRRFEQAKEKVRTSTGYRRQLAVWSSCVRKEGYAYSSERAMRNDVQKRLDRALGKDAFGGYDVSNLDLEALIATQTLERRLAKSAAACNRNFAPKVTALVKTEVLSTPLDLRIAPQALRMLETQQN